MSTPAPGRRGTPPAQAHPPEVGAAAGRPSPQRPLRRDAQRNRQRVLDAAQQVFAEQGLRASLDDVAERAGVGVGTVYRRFPDKEALVEALFEDRVGLIIEVTREALALPSGWDGLVHFLTTVSALQAGDRGLRETALSTGFGRSRVAVLRNRVNDALTRLIAAATAEGTLRSGITGHDIALILFMIGEAGQNHESTRPDLTQRYLQVILDGLRARPESRDLGRPMDDEDFERFVQGWGPSPRRSAPKGIPGQDRSAAKS